MPRFETQVMPRWGDLDAMGHVNNAAYVDYLQEARVDLLLRGPDGTGPVRELLGGGVLVAAHQVEFITPVTDTDQPLRVELWTEQVGAARFTVGYEIFDQDQLSCRARSVLCPFDLETQRVRRLAPLEREFFESVATTAAEPLHRLGKPSGQQTYDRDYALRVRWADLDSYGHVNNVRYFGYLQEARWQLLGELPQRHEGSWVLARQDIRYVEQLNHRSTPYLITTSAAHVGRTSMRFDAQILDPETDRVHASASAICVAVDPAGRPVPISGGR